MSGGGYGNGGNLSGSALNYSPSAGGIPQVPSPITTAATAARGNLSNLPDLTALAGQVNPATAAQYYGNIPNYAGLNAQSSTNISAQLRGELPQDVVNMLGQRAAERGVLTGQHSPAAYLSALGLNSLQLQQQGEAALSNSVARNTKAPFYAPAMGFVNPGDVQSAQSAANLYASAPSPGAAQAAAMRSAQTGLNAGYNATRAPAPQFQNPFMAFSMPQQQDDSEQVLRNMVQQFAPHLNTQEQQAAPAPYYPPQSESYNYLQDPESAYLSQFPDASTGTLADPGFYPGEY